MAAHPAPAAGHLDHHLRRTANHDGVNALAYGMGTFLDSSPGQLGRPCARDAIDRIEEPVAPLDENGIQVARCWHDELPSLCSSDQCRHSIEVATDINVYGLNAASVLLDLGRLAHAQQPHEGGQVH